MHSECKFGNLTSRQDKAGSRENLDYSTFSFVSPRSFLKSLINQLSTWSTAHEICKSIWSYKKKLFPTVFSASLFQTSLFLPSLHVFLSWPSYPLIPLLLIQLAFPPYLSMFTLIISSSFSASRSLTIIRLNTTQLGDLGPSVVWLVSNIMNPYVRKHFLVWHEDERTNYLSFQQETRWSQSL